MMMFADMCMLVAHGVLLSNFWCRMVSFSIVTLLIGLSVKYLIVFTNLSLRRYFALDLMDA